MLIAENTVDTGKLARYFESIPMNFNFPLATAVVEGVKSGDARPIRAALDEMARLYPRGVIDTPFLTNHDQTRVATVLGRDPRKLRNAAAILLTLPGTPFIYYGEEIGMENAPAPNDEAKRTPMAWSASGGFSTGTPWHSYSPGIATNNVAAQESDPDSVLTYYHDWIAARKRSAALMKGEITPLPGEPQVLAYLRQSGEERALVVHNLGSTAISVPLAADVRETIHADRGVAVTPAGIELPPHASGAWSLH